MLDITYARNYFRRMRDRPFNTIVKLLSFLAAIATLVSFFAGWPLLVRLSISGIMLIIISSYCGIRAERYWQSRSEIAVEGCIIHCNVLWRGQLKTKRNEWDKVIVNRDPICPDCQTPLKADWFQPQDYSGIRGENRRMLNKMAGKDQQQKIWHCPDCEAQYSRRADRADHSEAKKLFEKHFRKMWESSNEEYSYKMLQQRHRGKTGTSLEPIEAWKAYTAVVNDSKVATSCFS